MTASETKITRSKVEGKATENRLYTFTYSFDIKENKIVVCKTCFLSTLGETEKFVSCTMTNKLTSNSGITHTDKRGTHTPIHKTSETKLDEVRKHINSFLAYQSHYSRRHTDKKYLAPDLTLNKMYNLYCEQYNEKPVSIKIYSKVFHTFDSNLKSQKTILVPSVTL